MNFRYDKEDDVLMIWFSKEKIDFAEQSGDVIMHFSKKKRPVLMEILDASAFLKQTVTQFPKSIIESLLPQSSTPSIAYKKK